MTAAKKKLERNRRKGAALIYITVSMTTFAAMAMVAVDLGRMQVAKEELQAVADAAARYGVAGVKNRTSGNSAALQNVKRVVAENKVAGMPIIMVDSDDVTVGVWNSSNKTFTPNTDTSVANAVKVALSCQTGRGSGVPVIFGGMFGKQTFDLEANSIAMISFTTSRDSYDYTVPATSNPWLAGMPSGTSANNPNPAGNPDYAGTEYVDDGTTSSTQFTSSYSMPSSGSNPYAYNHASRYQNKMASPIKAGGSGMNVNSISTLTFDSATGGASNGPTCVWSGPDGQTDWVISNYKGNENGKSDIRAPINSLIAVFLDDNNPSTQGTAPTTLDFSSASSRDFTTLSPQLRQTFFIGDGRTSTGEVQRFVVPRGATRLYFGTMDGWEWNNNAGEFYTSLHAVGRVTTVK